METLLERFPDLAERTYEALQRGILTGQLAPGTELVIVDLAKKLGVSRSPVKHALARLCGEGLAVQVPGKGYFVSRVEGEQLKYLLDARLLVEVAAAERGVHLVTESELALMKSLVDEMARAISPDGGFVDYLESIKPDNAFHSLLVGSSRNPYLVQFHRLLNLHVFQARMHFTAREPGEARAVHVLEEHRAILAALEARDPLEAKTAVSLHIRNSMAVFGVEILESESEGTNRVTP